MGKSANGSPGREAQRGGAPGPACAQGSPVRCGCARCRQVRPAAVVRAHTHTSTRAQRCLRSAHTQLAQLPYPPAPPPPRPPFQHSFGQLKIVNQSINLLLFLQKQNLATAIYLFGLGTLLTGLGLKHMRICSHHDLVGALVTSLFLGRPWWSTTSPTCLPLSVFTITSDQHRCRIPPLL